MQIGRMNRAGIESHDDPLVNGVHLYILNSRNFHQRLAQLTDTFIAPLALRRDFNGLDNRLIVSYPRKRVGRVDIVRSGWIRHGTYLTQTKVDLVAPNQRSVGVMEWCDSGNSLITSTPHDSITLVFLPSPL